MQFIKFSGGLSGGLEPPAFQRAERERTMTTEAATDSLKNPDSSTFGGLEHKNELLNVLSDTMSILIPPPSALVV